jgi:hypothetical protein
MGKLSNIEKRWMKTQDHTINRQIVGLAKNNNISAIHLEKLQNTRNAKKSRKCEKILVVNIYTTRKNARSDVFTMEPS